MFSRADTNTHTHTELPPQQGAAGLAMLHSRSALGSPSAFGVFLLSAIGRVHIQCLL